MSRLAVGLRSGEGGAACIVVALDDSDVTFVARYEVALADETVEVQPYHAATAAPERADEIIDRAVALAGERAGALLIDVLGAMDAVAAIGVVLGNAQPPSRERALSSHVASHAAEGALYRTALLDAAVATGRPVLTVPERDVVPTLADQWGPDGAARIAALGATAGPPWRKPEKLAASVAVLALLSLT